MNRKTFLGVLATPFVAAFIPWRREPEFDVDEILLKGPMTGQPHADKLGEELNVTFDVQMMLKNARDENRANFIVMRYEN